MLLRKEPGEAGVHPTSQMQPLEGVPETGRSRAGGWEEQPRHGGVRGPVSPVAEEGRESHSVKRFQVKLK